MFGDAIFNFFSGLGPAGMVIALLLIFIVDATIFPALPELFAVIIFLSEPTLSWQWAVVVIFIALIGEVIGNSILYFIVKKARMPKRLERVMNKYVDFLLVKDEKIILVQRIAPVIPFVGAFIAACKWSYRKSMLYIVSGGLAKYSFLLVLVGVFNVMWTRELATIITIVMVVIMIVLSIVASLIYRRKKMKPVLDEAAKEEVETASSD
jgi:hypothetical protein